MGRGRRAVVLRWGAWVAGVGLVVLLVYRVGPASVFGALSRVGFRIFWVIAAYLGAQVVMALPWWWLLDKPVRPSLGAAIRSRLAASGLNALLPLVGAGEVVRILWLRRAAWTQGVAALVADRVMFALASVGWLVAGAGAAWALPRVRTRVAPAILVGALALGSLAVAVIFLGRRGRMLTSVRRRGVKLWNAVLRLSPTETEGAPPAAEMDVLLEQLFRAPRRLVPALLIHLVGRAFMVVEVFVALRAIDVHATSAQVLVLVAVPLALAFVAAAIPSQVGLAEGALAGVAAALGLGASAGLALVLLQRARQLMFVPVTALLLHARRKAATVALRNTEAGAR